MKILVTGASGRLGRHVLRQLQRHELVEFVRALPDGVNDPDRFRLGDVTRLAEIVDAARGHDVILHMAGRAHAKEGEEDVVFATNVGGMFNVLEAARRNGIKRIVYTSSARAFGVGFAEPFSTPDYFPVDEDHPSRACDTYGVSKLMAEQVCRHFARHHGMTVIVLRLPWVFSLEEFALAEAGVDRPELRPFGLWAWVDIRDACQAIELAVANCELKGYHDFLIAGADVASQWTNPELRERFYPDVPWIGKTPAERQSFYDWSKARHYLGYEPRHVFPLETMSGSPADGLRGEMNQEAHR